MGSGTSILLHWYTSWQAAQPFAAQKQNKNLPCQQIEIQFLFSAGVGMLRWQRYRGKLPRTESASLSVSVAVAVAVSASASAAAISLWLSSLLFISWHLFSAAKFCISICNVLVMNGCAMHDLRCRSCRLPHAHAACHMWVQLQLQPISWIMQTRAKCSQADSSCESPAFASFLFLWKTNKLFVIIAGWQLAADRVRKLPNSSGLGATVAVAAAAAAPEIRTRGEAANCQRRRSCQPFAQASQYLLSHLYCLPGSVLHVFVWIFLGLAQCVKFADRLCPHIFDFISNVSDFQLFNVSSSPVGNDEVVCALWRFVWQHTTINNITKLSAGGAGQLSHSVGAEAGQRVKS